MHVVRCAGAPLCVPAQAQRCCGKAAKRTAGSRSPCGRTPTRRLLGPAPTHLAQVVVRLGWQAEAARQRQLAPPRPDAFGGRPQQARHHLKHGGLCMATTAATREGLRRRGQRHRGREAGTGGQLASLQLQLRLQAVASPACLLGCARIRSTRLCVPGRGGHCAAAPPGCTRSSTGPQLPCRSPPPAVPPGRWRWRVRGKLNNCCFVFLERRYSNTCQIKVAQGQHLSNQGGAGTAGMG